MNRINWSARRRVRLRGLLPALVLLSIAGCSSRFEESAAPQGVIVINVSGLRSDFAAASWADSSVSHHLSSFLEGALVYERAFAVSSDPLAAQVSLLSGLYPQEHGVVPPESALTSEAPVMAERFADSGYRTAAFTAGGYASPSFGIDRGFDEFGIPVAPGDGATPVFSSGLDFLRRVGDDPFFLYLHSAALEGRRGMGGSIALDRLAAGFEELTPELLETVNRAYEDEIRGIDAELGELLRGLGELGLGSRTVVLLTADRGLEMGEHGRIGGSQVYPESLRVPLLLSVPGGAAGRRTDLVQTVDVAASLYALAGLPGSGVSERLLPGVPGAFGPRSWAAAQSRGRWAQESLLVEAPGESLQLIESRLRGDYDGVWVTREVAFDTTASALDFAIVSYRVPRTLAVSVDGHALLDLEARAEWGKVRIELPPVDRPVDRPDGAVRRRVAIAAAGCMSPNDVGEGADRRCLSFKIRGIELSRTELFDLAADPGAELDVSFERAEDLARLKRELLRHRWLDVPRPDLTRAATTALERINSRGEAPEPPLP